MCKEILKPIVRSRELLQVLNELYKYWEQEQYLLKDEEFKLHQKFNKSKQLLT